MPEPEKRKAISDNWDRYLYGVLLFTIVLCAVVYVLTNYGLKNFLGP